MVECVGRNLDGLLGRASPSTRLSLAGSTSTQGVAVPAGDRKRLEHLCRNVLGARPKNTGDPYGPELRRFERPRVPAVLTVARAAWRVRLGGQTVPEPLSGSPCGLASGSVQGTYRCSGAPISRGVVAAHSRLPCIAVSLFPASLQVAVAEAIHVFYQLLRSSTRLQLARMTCSQSTSAKAIAGSATIAEARASIRILMASPPQLMVKNYGGVPWAAQV
jgi:hypothetical protein